MNSLGLAVIGAGRIGRIHARNIQAHDRAILHYVADPMIEAARALAQPLGAQPEADPRRVLADRRIDAVVIASPTDTHAQWIDQASQAGKAILCEKPLDLDVDKARRCVDMARSRNCLLTVGFNRRFDPSFSRLQAELARGAIGMPEQVLITSRDPAPPPADYIRGSGGLFRDMTIHDLDMARWLLGEEPVQVFACGSCLVDAAIGEAGDVDSAMLTLITASGRLAHINNSRRAVYGYDQRIEVHGSQGCLGVGNPPRSQLWRMDGDGQRTDGLLDFFMERYSEAYRLELDDFVRAVLGEKKPLADGADGVRALELADAAWRSHSSRRMVSAASDSGA